MDKKFVIPTGSQVEKLLEGLVMLVGGVILLPYAGNLSPWGAIIAIIALIFTVMIGITRIAHQLGIPFGTESEKKIEVTKT